MRKEYKKYSREFKELVADEYMNGRTSNQLSQKYNIPIANIFIWLKHLRYKIRTKEESKRYRRKLEGFNEDYFSKIDTEDKAYWLGFIQADGCIVTNYKKHLYQLSIGLCGRDIMHLKSFIKCIGSISKITHCDKGNGLSVNTVHIGSKRMVSDLLILGIYPRKARTTKPIKLNTELQIHYWRGVFDGDGCISYDRRPQKNYPNIDLAGNKYMCDGFKLFMNIKNKIYGRGPTYHAKVFRRSEVKRVLTLLYSNAQIALGRKYALAMEVINN